MSTIALLGALAFGILAGLLSSIAQPVAAVVGTLWVNALRMTVLPLVVSLVVTSIGVVKTSVAGRITTRALLLFLLIMSAVGLIAALVVPLALDRLVLTAMDTDKLRAEWKPPAAVPPFSAWLTTLIPINPVASAAEGNLLPVIVFAVALGLALTSIQGDRAATVLGFFHGIAAAMLQILSWVLKVAPIGVFALGYTLAQAGAGVAGALGFYVATLFGLNILVLTGLYLSMAILRPVPFGSFVRALLPAQTVAAGTRSSMAALPALISAAENDLRLPPSVIGIVLPLSVTLLRTIAPSSLVLAIAFTAKLFEVPLGSGQILWAAVMSVLLSFSVPGVPGGSLLIAVPLFQTLGLPIQAIGILLAVDMLPDTIKTVTNVTGHLAAASLLSRVEGGAATER